MENLQHVHLLFEQSGTFKDAFAKFNIPATDYDIADDYERTDVRINLFTEIVAAYAGDPSVFDYIAPGDLAIAFFPCIYFAEYNVNLFAGTAHNFRTMERAACIEYILRRADYRNMYYKVLIKLCAVFERRGLRLIVENPFGVNHYLWNNFPYKPAVVDYNRRVRGDYYRKPTQYFFINCEPCTGITYQRPKNVRRIDEVQCDHHGTKERSEIAPEYARNFIRDFILGKPTINTQLSIL